ncbi:Leucine rich repeat 4 [Corchorus capsularis]|uniref:Leucine rich repeat 4 n=1 Tax=Corchorus capsularis TaxID=210143 RepID=A0A1R3JQP0_COCAP|nr:Leucine rich repeat 4 [Corchorus capsularis]
MVQSAGKASGSGGLAQHQLLKEEEEWAAEEVQLLDDPTSPNHLSLIALMNLQGNYELTAIPPLFFRWIALLQVLDLSGTNIKSLPKSLPKLVSLKKLLLQCCVLFMELSPKVGELANLEELDLHKTQIIDLPRDIGKLIKLRYLRVSFYPICGKMKLKSNAVVHPETISNLSQLSDLSIDVDPVDKRVQ